MLKTLVQPGPPESRRLQSVAGPLRTAHFDIPAGQSLLGGIGAGMARAGLRSGTVMLADVRVQPLQYVRPTDSADARHVAFYSETHRIETPVHLQRAVATFGEKEGQPFLHCHALWTDAEGRLKGGHLHNDVVRVCDNASVRAWGLGNAAMSVAFDAETNFHLFEPRPVGGPSPVDGQARCVVAKVRPNEDLLTGIESICAEHGLRRARIAGSVGSIVGATFTDGRRVDDLATEILVMSGEVETPDSGAPGQGSPRARLQIALIDPQGDVHVGELARGENAVLICFELVLVEA